MGLTGSKLEKALGANVPENERYFGFENFGNTCYCNSVLQALYFCCPFRERLLEYMEKPPKSSEEEDNLLICLGDLFSTINNQRKKTGVLAPRKFIQKLRKENELFRGYMHQDAHEFLNYLLNVVAEILQKEQKDQKKEQEEKEQQLQQNNHSGTTGVIDSGNGNVIAANGLTPPSQHSSPNSSSTGNGAGGDNASTTSSGSDPDVDSDGKKKKKTSARKDSTKSSVGDTPIKSYPNTEGGTFVHDIFEGTLTNETKCLCCECITSKDESFLDLSIDVEQNSSLTNCLFNFSSIETLSRGDKFYCDKCCSLQEAQKRMKIKKLPKILVVHLKRFKFIEQLNQHKKLSYRVVFPLELILQNTSHDAIQPDTRYNLIAVVVHLGSGPNHGHYVSMIKSANTWLLFDDDNIEVIQESDIMSCFGSASDVVSNTDCGYLLFYQATNEI
eukprot:Phypoly_transcript_03821.p1 GENE.Phypoly_transcript_03821~~Phypoly_transcript_03821.p1  ORF type:complete len:444 (+),score=69.75 Phypoly_transcript_03821:960-2291(+)